MQKVLLSVLVTILLVAGIGVGYQAIFSQPTVQVSHAGTEPGKPSPTVAIFDASGNSVSLDSLQAQKILAGRYDRVIVP